jgi:hypothetical protein
LDDLHFGYIAKFTTWFCVCVCVCAHTCATIWCCYLISVWIVVKLWLEWTKNLLLLPKSRCVKIWPKYCIQKWNLLSSFLPPKHTSCMSKLILQTNKSEGPMYLYYWQRNFPIYVHDYFLWKNQVPLSPTPPNHTTRVVGNLFIFFFPQS